MLLTLLMKLDQRQGKLIITRTSGVLLTRLGYNSWKGYRIQPYRTTYTDCLNDTSNLFLNSIEKKLL